jgi:hypothetical protein
MSHCREIWRSNWRDTKPRPFRNQHLQFQQNPATLPIAVVVLAAINNRMETLRPLIPEVLEVLKRIRPGQLIHVPMSR